MLLVHTDEKRAVIELLTESSNNGVFRRGEVGKVAKPFGAYPQEYSALGEDALLAEGSR